MTNEERLRAGIEALQKGDGVTASKYLMQVVQTDPNSELGWLWLGYSRTAADQREYCFDKVLSINPQNAEARHQIELLNRLNVIPQETQQTDKFSSLPPVSQSPAKESQLHTQSISQKPQPRKPLVKKSRRNKYSALIWIGLGLVFIICVCISGYTLFRLFTPQGNVPLLQPTIIAPPIHTPTPNYQPIFEPAECEFVRPMQVRVSCGYVRVPEDRSGDLNDTIHLAVAIYHSHSETPNSDPILYLQGGPGGKAISWSIGAYETVIAPLLVDRDFIVFDPRGVGYSKPALDCEEFESTYLHDIEGALPSDQKLSYYEGAMLTCKNNFNRLGANPSAYTSVEMATDVRDVIRALGYGQANLYGISYGTRIAQFVMRAHPEVVRSAILDSVVPVETQLLMPDSNAESERLIHLLFEECNADPACSSSFPDLDSAYNEAVARLDAEPVTVTLTISREKTIEQTINGSTFRNTIVWGLRHPQTMASIPYFIYRTRDGDYSQLTYAAAIPLTTFNSITIGSYIAVICHDQVFAIPTEGLDETIYSMCNLWGVEAPVPGENDPVNSNIPTLIFAGKYDSVTPTTFAAQLAGHLGHSYVVEIPNQGHAPSATGISDCPSKIIFVFLQDPANAPDVSCVGEINKINFVLPFNPNTPLILEPVTIEEYQISTLAPADWTKSGFGFFSRLGFIGDTSQIGSQRAAVSEAEWVTWLYTNFRGGEGFDQPAVRVDERQANGFTWTIYQTTSGGNPVDIAFAKSGKETLMVLLISHKDEHNALYNAIFLPVIDATRSTK